MIDWTAVSAIVATATLIGAVLWILIGKVRHDTRVFTGLVALTKTVKKQGVTLESVQDSMGKLVVILERQEGLRKDVNQILAALDRKVDKELCDSRYRGDEK